MKKFFGKSLLLAFGLCCTSLLTFADPPGPPGPGGDPGGSGGIPVGGPIDNGILILLFLAVGYAAWKLYSARKEKSEIVS
jgi:hypothetical protein